MLTQNGNSPIKAALPGHSFRGIARRARPALNRKSLAAAALLLAAGWVSARAATGAIPFPAALRDANVEVAQMTSGQRESLIVGNGDLYGIVWEKEGGLFLRITKNDIWDARVDTSADGPLPKVNIRTRQVTGSTGGPPSYNKPFPQPRCAVALRLGAAQPAAPAAGFRAALDLEHAVATLSRPNASQTTTVRVLADRNVLLIDGAEPVRIEEIRAATLPPARTGVTEGVAWLHMILPGDPDYRGMEYAVAAAAAGRTQVVSLVTSFDGPGQEVLPAALALARKTLEEAVQSRAQLLAQHELAWHDFWARSGVSLADRDLQRWWYRMLYFARTLCQPGTLPVALMPPLATDDTPWHGDYHFNYNSWQPFWSVISPNHPELADPWISYVHNLRARAQWVARETFDCDGVYYSISQFLHEPDPAACVSRNKRQLTMSPWGMTIGMVGMTAQNLWHKHLCDPDRAYLEAKIYPTLRDAARFYLSFMKQCSKDAAGKIRLGPSYSPEHGDLGIDNCPFDIAYVHYTFDAFDQASRELGQDRELAAECLAMKALLADYPVALDAAGQPVVVDWTGCKYKQVGVHNITVPASPVFPGEQVTWFSPEPVKELFRRTIRDTRFNGNNSHIIFNIAKARLSMLEAVTECKTWFKSRELPNGLFVWQGHAHGTFMPESIGVAALVTEFLMQSVGNTIRVFPCWPAGQEASFKDLRAQGGFLVSADYARGGVQRVSILATVGGSLRLLSPWKTVLVNGRETAVDASGVVVLPAQARATYTFTAGK